MLTRERILLTALDLFSKKGYDAVSTSAIAGELGLTKGALYRHFPNKEAIFESILRRMEYNDAESAAAYDMPAQEKSVSAEGYAQASLDALISYSLHQFRYWTLDGFACPFRRLLTLEQYGSERMAKLFSQYITGGPIAYLEDIFAEIAEGDARLNAVQFYAPMFAAYALFDNGESFEELQDLLGAHFASFSKNISLKRTEN